MQSYSISVNEGGVRENSRDKRGRRDDEQKAKAPAMMPLATAVGKSLYARRVNGHSRAPNSTGGMTRRRLYVYR